MASESVNEARLVGTLEGLTLALEGFKAAAAAPAAAPAPAAAGAPAATGQCCGAYPGEALKEALSLPVAPKDLTKELPQEEIEKLGALNEKSVDARIDLLRKSAWATAPEMVLLEACEIGERPTLAQKMLEVRAGLGTTDDELREAEKELEEERVEVAKVARETLAEGLEQMKRWTALAELGKNMLITTTVFSAVMIVAVIIFASENKIGETATPIIVFVLAIFAISPAVLLLRERPLEGLDKFTPGGPTGGDSDTGGSGSGEGSAK